MGSTSQVFGSKGTLLLDRCRPTYDTLQPQVLFQTKCGRLVPSELASREPKKWAPLEAFLQKVLHRRDASAVVPNPSMAVLSSLKESLETVRIIEAIYQSAELRSEENPSSESTA
jgi:predicted dehydrogenase